MKRSVVGGALAGLCAGVVFNAWAQPAAPADSAVAATTASAAPLPSAFTERLPRWEAGFGAGLVQLPHYRGSEQSHRWAVPVPYFIYRGDFLRADRGGARAVLMDGDRVDFDLSLGASPPVQSEDNRARAGMDDLAPTLEIGPKLNIRLGEGRVDGRPWRLVLRLPVRAALALDGGVRDAGFTLEPVLNLDVKTAWGNVGVLGGPLWGSRRWHQFNYGVGAADATATRPAYEASSGFAGWQATVGVSRRFGPVWAGAFWRFDHLGGAAFADSPLRTARQHSSLGLAFAYVFAQSEDRVQTQD
jgi:outer membrane scaffolding protein for murein synthesis (MipA/OmpV family)